MEAMRKIKGREDAQGVRAIQILIVGKGTNSREVTHRLSEDRCRMAAVKTGSEALRFLQRGEADVVILDMNLAEGNGLDLLSKVKVMRPNAEVVMIVDPGDVEAAVKAIKLGAFDCLTIPIKQSSLMKVIVEAHKSKTRRERKAAADGNGSDKAPHELVGRSVGIQEVRKLIDAAGPSDVPVLILGETGTGKELVARAIHKASNRSKGPFVTVNASSLPENLMASELFGHMKGAFTGAHMQKTGLLETAQRGTFFIDEVGDMDPVIQARLLRVIETGAFRKLGDTKEISVDVRFVSATNRILENDLRAKAFRPDLFFRLSTFIIHLPPLRDRKEDIPMLVDYFLSGISRGGAPKRLSSEALELLMDFSWPGNVRELLNVLERASLLSPGEDRIEADNPVE